MGRKATLVLTSAAGIRPRTGLAIDGEDVLRVIKVRGSTVTVVRWRWWHTKADKVRNAPGRWWRGVLVWAEVRWCGRGGRRLDSDGYCRCGERAHPDWMEDW